MDKTPDPSQAAGSSAQTLFAQFRDKLGPGLLFAASAVGVSHLVQSTRAGANYGLALISLVLISCLIKYPAFRFSTDYAAATGQTLIDNYYRQGKSAIAIYLIDAMTTLFVATAATALVTAGLVNNMIPFTLNDSYVACALLVVITAILLAGRYHLFERVTKVFVVLFTLLIFAAVLLTAPEFNWQNAQLVPEVTMDKTQILFFIAIAGWMPTPMGASVFQSLWVAAKTKDLGRALTPKEARFDFNLGYILTVFLALCFLFMGAALMHEGSISVPATASGFAALLINMFVASIGSWALPLISLAAFAVMFSTVMTIVDGYPRAFNALFERINKAPDQPGKENTYYTVVLLIQVLGAILLILFFMQSFKTFIDFATSVAFLTAPLIGWLNHRAMFSEEVPASLRPKNHLRYWSLSSVLVLSICAVTYIYYAFVLS